MARRIIIEGIVGGAGAGGAGNSRGAWDLVFSLDPWRRRGEALVAAELDVRIPVSERKLDAQMEKIRPDLAVRVTVTELVPPARGRAKWWRARGVLPVKPIKADAALRAIVEERSDPIVLRDRVLGALTLDRRVNWYCVRRKAGGHAFELAIERDKRIDDRAGDAALIAKARTVATRLERQLPAARDAIAKGLLALYNTTWREDQPVLSRAAFKRRPRLTSIVVHVDRSATMYFGDDDLFLGHSIVVPVGARGAFGKAGIAG